MTSEQADHIERTLAKLEEYQARLDTERYPKDRLQLLRKLAKQ